MPGVSEVLELKDHWRPPVTRADALSAKSADRLFKVHPRDVLGQVVCEPAARGPVACARNSE